MLRTRGGLAGMAVMLGGIILAAPVWAQTPGAALMPLDHSAYERWAVIKDAALSNDGRWVLYRTEPRSEQRDAFLTITTTELAGGPASTSPAGVSASAAGPTYRIARASSARFSADSRLVVFLLPADTLGLLDLATGAVRRVVPVRSFTLPQQAGGWLAYQLARAEPAGAIPPADRRAARAGSGAPLVLRHMTTGEERRLEGVLWYTFTPDGARLVYTHGTPRGETDGVYALETRTGTTTMLLAGMGEYRHIALDPAGRQVAFLSTVGALDHLRQSAGAPVSPPAWALYHWDGRAAGARRLVTSANPGLPPGAVIAERPVVRFSPNGQRIFFSTAPRATAVSTPSPSTYQSDTAVRVDIWHWQQPLPPQQRKCGGCRQLPPPQEAVVDVRDGRVVPLEPAGVQLAGGPSGGDGDIVFGHVSKRGWWDLYETRDVYSIDMRTGATTRLLEGVNSGVSRPSPSGRYLALFDRARRAWFAVDRPSRAVRNLTERIPFPVHDEDWDEPGVGGAWGEVRWTTDERLLICDRHDLWVVDPSGRAAPRNLTQGVGRRDNLRFRLVLPERGRLIEPDADLLLSAVHLGTKAEGFYRTRVNGSQPPVRLLLADKHFELQQKAAQANVVLLTRSDFREFPDLWVADGAFRQLRKVSDVNPQQAEYRWGTAELVSWQSGDGQALQGVLYKPDGFDPTRKYPLIVNIYERFSDKLHEHHVPELSADVLDIPTYVSQGYLVFRPDIRYRIGYAGESAVKAVVPGVASLIARGFVDAKRVGLQGHSFGGYETLYLVTKTGLFRAAVAAAPISNLVSDYGSIVPDADQKAVYYEQRQARLGGTLWERPQRFIENSPIFGADQVTAPLLLMHGDKDDIVPWEQGVAFFNALRRLQKPVWLLTYPGQYHSLGKAANRRDYTLRMQQFFDHYLRGTPPPVWLVHGVPVQDQGRTLGLELLAAPTPASMTRPQTGEDSSWRGSATER